MQLDDVGLVDVDGTVLVFVFFDGRLHVGAEKIGKALALLFQNEFDLLLLRVGQVEVDCGCEFLAVRHA